MTDLTAAIDRLAGAIPANPDHHGGTAVDSRDLQTVIEHLRGIRWTGDLEVQANPRYDALMVAIEHTRDTAHTPEQVVNIAKTFEAYLNHHPDQAA